MTKSESSITSSYFTKHHSPQPPIAIPTPRFPPATPVPTPASVAAVRRVNVTSWSNIASSPTEEVQPVAERASSDDDMIIDPPLPPHHNRRPNLSPPASPRLHAHPYEPATTVRRRGRRPKVVNQPEYAATTAEDDISSTTTIPPPPPSDNNLTIHNNYSSLLSLIDSEYPPSLCPACQHVFQSRQDADHHVRTFHAGEKHFLCIHPHCDRRYSSRGGLRYHLEHSHIITWSPKPLPDPQYSYHHYTVPTFYPPAPSSAPVSPTASVPPSASIPPSTFVPACAPVLEGPTSVGPIPVGPKSILPLPTTHLIRPILPFPPNLSPHLPPPLPLGHPLPLHPHAGKLPLPPMHVRHFLPKRAPKTPRPILSAASAALLDSVYDPLKCPACSAVMRRKTNVIKHLVETHRGQEPYRCVVKGCTHPKSYATREGLVYHIQHYHEQGEGQEEGQGEGPEEGRRENQGEGKEESQRERKMSIGERTGEDGGSVAGSESQGEGGREGEREESQEEGSESRSVTASVSEEEGGHSNVEREGSWKFSENEERIIID